MPVGRKPKYDWQTWLDGNLHKLTAGQDFLMSAVQFQQQVYNVARRKGVKVSTQIKGDVLYVQLNQEWMKEGLNEIEQREKFHAQQNRLEIIYREYEEKRKILILEAEKRAGGDENHSYAHIANTLRTIPIADFVRCYDEGQFQILEFDPQSIQNLPYPESE